MTTVTRPQPATLRAQLRKKVVVVTGAASGIGFAITELFATHGATVIAVDVNPRNLQAAIDAFGSTVVPYQCDVSFWEQQVQFFDWVQHKFGKLDVLCCNAGIDPEIATASETDSPEGQHIQDKVGFNWLANECEGAPVDGKLGTLKRPPDTIFDINVKGVIYGIKLALHLMEGQRGNIIVTGSAGSYVGIPEQDIYAASKHALLGLIRSTARRPGFESRSVALSMVAPWLTKTPLVAHVAKDRTENTIASSPEDIAWAVAYLVTVPYAQANGKCVWVQGNEMLEVEDSYAQWLAPLIRK
jgi:NAD(P)-dependent dehydrogenase (short-subunit alcohol dehydrogenase family)